MVRHETRRVEEGGSIVIPANIRREFGIKPGDLIEFEERDDGVLLRPVEAAPREHRWIPGR